MGDRGSSRFVNHNSDPSMFLVEPTNTEADLGAAMRNYVRYTESKLAMLQLPRKYLRDASVDGLMFKKEAHQCTVCGRVCASGGSCPACGCLTVRVGVITSPPDPGPNPVRMRTSAFVLPAVRGWRNVPRPAPNHLWKAPGNGKGPVLLRIEKVDGPERDRTVFFEILQDGQIIGRTSLREHTIMTDGCSTPVGLVLPDRRMMLVGETWGVDLRSGLGRAYAHLVGVGVCPSGHGVSFHIRWGQDGLGNDGWEPFDDIVAGFERWTKIEEEAAPLMSFGDQAQRKADAAQADMLKAQLDKLIAENQRAFSTLTGGVLRVEVVRDVPASVAPYLGPNQVWRLPGGGVEVATSMADDHVVWSDGTSSRRYEVESSAAWECIGLMLLDGRKMLSGETWRYLDGVPFQILGTGIAPDGRPSLRTQPEGCQQHGWVSFAAVLGGDPQHWRKQEACLSVQGDTLVFSLSRADLAILRNSFYKLAHSFDMRIILKLAGCDGLLAFELVSPERAKTPAQERGVFQASASSFLLVHKAIKLCLDGGYGVHRLIANFNGCRFVEIRVRDAKHTGASLGYGLGPDPVTAEEIAMREMAHRVAVATGQSEEDVLGALRLLEKAFKADREKAAAKRQAWDHFGSFCEAVSSLGPWIAFRALVEAVVTVLNSRLFITRQIDALLAADAAAHPKGAVDRARRIRGWLERRPLTDLHVRAAAACLRRYHAQHDPIRPEVRRFSKLLGPGKLPAPEPPPSPRPELQDEATLAAFERAFGSQPLPVER